MVRMNGNFSDQNCNSVHNFICKKAQDYSSDFMNFGCGMWNRAGRKCYQFYQGPQTTWADARKRCQSISGDLLKVTNKDEMYWITNQMMMHRQKYWIGLNDIASEGNYVWTDGTASQSQLIMWNQEPNDYSGQEDCGIIFSNGGYNDADCTMKAAFICELVAQASCSAGWISRTMTQGLDCYYFSDYKNSTNLRTWSEAQYYCVAQAPSPTAVPLLLSVDDAAEKAYIEQQLSGMRDNVPGWWTGLTDKDREGYWSFVGQAVIADTSLIPWNSQPDNSADNLDCVSINYAGHYETNPCDVKIGFICERPVSLRNGAGKIHDFTMAQLIAAVLFPLLVYFQ